MHLKDHLYRTLTEDEEEAGQHLYNICESCQGNYNSHGQNVRSEYSQMDQNSKHKLGSNSRAMLTDRRIQNKGNVKAALEGSLEAMSRLESELEKATGLSGKLGSATGDRTKERAG